MFLTRFHVDPRRPAGWRALQDPQRMHAIIAGATSASSTPKGDPGRSLWRLDRDEPANPTLWVVSTVRPDLDSFAADAGKVVTGTIYESRPYDTLLDQLQTGQVYAFRLAANAVRSGRRLPGSETTQRFGHVTAAQQVEWLKTRAQQHGFSLCTSSTREPDVAVTGGRRLTFFRQGRRVTIALTELMGHLEVDDPALLRRSLVTGIGHARAYGCGLLSLAPPKRK